MTGANAENLSTPASDVCRHPALAARTRHQLFQRLLVVSNANMYRSLWLASKLPLAESFLLTRQLMATRRIRRSHVRAYVLLQLSTVLLGQGRRRRAIWYLAQCVSSAREEGRHRAVVILLARTLIADGQLGRAREVLNAESMARGDSVGDLPTLSVWDDAAVDFLLGLLESPHAPPQMPGGIPHPLRNALAETASILREQQTRVP